ncbi:MAG: ABC transporter ATP-binding protein [Chloroflexota bacterium]|nr:ABC transporter ATP-binding protein [Chloroflexota bacterium]
MGFFHGLDRESYDRKYSDRELALRLVQYFQPHSKQLVSTGGLIAVLSFIAALQPVLISRALDTLIVNRQRLDVILGIVLFMLGYGTLNWGGSWVRRRTIAHIIADIMTTLRTAAFTACLNHDMSFFDEFRSGRIISRITTDTEEFATVVQMITELIGQILQVIILTGYLFTISWRLTLLLLGMAPFVMLTAWSFRKLARKVTRKGFQVLAEVNAAIQEAVTGISVAKNFRQEATIYQEFNAVNQQSYRVNLWRGYSLSSMFPALNALSGIGTAILVYYGGLPTTVGAITIGSWYLFISSLDRFWFPMLNLSAFWSQIQGGLSAAERVFALIDARPAVQQQSREPVNKLQGEISFNQVHFRYTEQEQILANFSLRIQPGESVALVGHTGAGKSSLAKLVARFYEFQQGQILIDGRDIRTLDLHQYRRQLGIVSQTPFLFSGTVLDNIRYGRPEITPSAVENIAYHIGNGEWLTALPHGLHTNVGERGSKLSMGQRQLVALMRVLVQEPAIFILDEATASIDPFTEMQIQEATALILARSTSILIAHRLSTIRAVERIIVLRTGRIIEEGNHETLMACGGHYAELYNTYFRHQSLEYVEEVGRRKLLLERR